MFAAYNASLSAIMVQYGISEEVALMKTAMLNDSWIDDMESGDADA